MKSESKAYSRRRLGLMLLVLAAVLLVALDVLLHPPEGPLRPLPTHQPAPATPSRTAASGAVSRATRPLASDTPAVKAPATATPLATDTPVEAPVTPAPLSPAPGAPTSAVPAATETPPESDVETIEQYSKFELALTADFSGNPYLPYDPGGPEQGVSVDMVATGPDGAHQIPCFYYQPVDEHLLPTGSAHWRCRYTPAVPGAWTYQVTVLDQNGGREAGRGEFRVVPGSGRGFVRVSAADRRYFEFSNGEPFLYGLVNVEGGNPLNSLEGIRSSIPLWGSSGVRFVRWGPTGEGANFYVIPYGEDIRQSWAFGDAHVVAEGDPQTGQLFSFQPYRYTSQDVPSSPGAHYRLSLRARVTGDKVFRPEVGDTEMEIRASDWQDHVIETVATEEELRVKLADVTPDAGGTIRVYDVSLQRLEGDTWGPNLLTRGDPDTFRYVDQLGAARLDEVLRLSEEAGVYHKLTLFQKNDKVLGRLGRDGSPVEWSVDNFYNSPVARWYQRAYARYFIARWSYSPALHSIELANENNLDEASQNAALDVLGYARSTSPRPLLISNSFWGFFPDKFWQNPLIDYADRHWYADGQAKDRNYASPTWTDSAANVRECVQHFEWLRDTRQLQKPIVRGETGVWMDSKGLKDLGAGADTYYHKQLWAQMGDNCHGEWYTEALAELNLWPRFALYASFLASEPINNGRYRSIGTDLWGENQIAITVESGAARAWGKIAPEDGRGFLWIDNSADTWRAVSDGAQIPPATAALTVNGLSDGNYTVTWYDTYTGNETTEMLRADGGTLTLRVVELAHDIAVKFARAE